MTSTQSISTRTLDHIVHLTPPASLDETANQFRNLGFTVSPGGTHADGLTANVLVFLADGVYLELISFTHEVDHYTPGSPERKARENHRWASKAPGWIDYAFLGNGSKKPSESISRVINERAEKESSGVEYVPEVDGGRKKPDGEVLEWVISAPKSQKYPLPFFCGDVTPRKRRVPTDSSNSSHASTVLGISSLRLLVTQEAFSSTVSQLTSVIGHPAEIAANVREASWKLDTHLDTGLAAPVLVVATPKDDFESDVVSQNGSGSISEVVFSVTAKNKVGHAQTPYGRIRWIYVDEKH